MNLQDTLTTVEQKLDVTKKIKIYLCGVTVYDESHIGHARTIIVFDVLRKYLESKKVEVDFVQNFTDVDDKIINRATKENVTAEEISSKYIKNYFKDFEDLNVKRATNYPKATEHIEDIIEFIKKLVGKEIAYVTKNGVYFAVSKFSEYGKLSKKKVDELQSGSRIQIDEAKNDPADFAVWKFSDINPTWESPWGKGRPGWHIECSVMSLKYLGENFDIHGGGRDLIFPHHENEIAQSCCNNSTNNFANYWIHNGFVTMNKEKMSKSLGNIVTISEAVKKYSGQVVRLTLLSAHYSQPLDWNEQLLVNQNNTIDKWYNLYEKTYDENILNISEILFDDLNTPGFIAKIHELYNSANKGDNKSKKLFNGACRLLGLFDLNKDEWESFKKSKYKISEEIILKKIKERIEARNDGNFQLADKIRNELLDNGIVIEDKKGKTKWKFK